MPERGDRRTYAIIGAAMEVHRQLGCGFLEAVYQEALALELTSRGIASRREVDFPISYRKTRLSFSYRADFLCFDEIIVELKAMRALGGAEEAQIINYLKASGLAVGLLLNFGTTHLEHKRFVRSAGIRSA